MSGESCASYLSLNIEKKCRITHSFDFGGDW